MSLMLKKYDKDNECEYGYLLTLWNEYGSFFKLKKEQPEYYYGEFQDEFQRIKSAANQDTNLYFVYVTRSQIPIGMFQLIPTSNNDICELKKILILESFRNNGYGNLVVSHVLQEARSQGYNKCILDVLKTESKAAHRAYVNNGFKVVKSTSFKTNNDVLWMECSL